MYTILTVFSNVTRWLESNLNPRLFALCTRANGEKENVMITTNASFPMSSASDFSVDDNK